MDDQTPEMEQMSARMRELMRLWIEHPNDAGLKRRYEDAQAAYQRMFLAYKQSQLDGAAPQAGSRGGYEI